MQTFSVSGMTCSHCVAQVTSLVKQLPNVESVNVSLAENKVEIKSAQLVPLASLQQLFQSSPYSIQAEGAAVILPQEKPLDWRDAAVWKRAAFNTFNCLIGCSLGDFGMIIFLQYYYPQTSMTMQMLLATVAGLTTSVGLETFILHIKEKMLLRHAFSMAIGMSFISMVVMELAMNITDFMFTGGKMALSNPSYWVAFLPSALVGFLAPLPYNYYRLKKYNAACH